MMDVFSSSWYKVLKDFSVISQSENKNFDCTPTNDVILWIKKSGPHGWFPTPDLFDDPIYHYDFFDNNNTAIKQFHILNEWYLVGISTIERFRESGYAQLHIQDPKKIVKTRKLWGDTSRNLHLELCFIRDILVNFDSWEMFEKNSLDV